AHRLYDDELVGTTLTEKATAWLRKQSDKKPFFLYLATTNIHHPFTPHKRFVGTSECGLYGDFIHELDWMVGEILATLDKLKVADNTLVIFTSDNGGMLNVTGQKAWKAGHRLNGDLLGFKFGAWEGGHRIPLIARWPGKIPVESTSDLLISQVDLLATLAAIVGRTLKDEEGQDSINQLPSLTGKPSSPPRETLIIAPNSPKHLAIRQGKWMYIPAPLAGGFQGKRAGDHLFSDAAAIPFTERTNSDVKGGKLRAGAPRAQLYDLEVDPAQETNVFDKHPDKVKQLSATLEEYRKQIPPGKPLGWINLKQ
ncbi:MAG: sulfatase-like hydrolase/transferase, partial [Pirellulales bacterium]|nr:sulfatase-like hydrolase/transferase [Pirellulales bacterium]